MSKEIEKLQNQLYISDKAHQRVCVENVELEQKIEELQKENTKLKEQDIEHRKNLKTAIKTIGGLKRHIKELQDELSCS